MADEQAAQLRHHAEHSPEPVFAFIYIALSVPGATGVLYPIFEILLSPILAAAMSLSRVSVIGNAWRLRRLPLEMKTPETV